MSGAAWSPLRQELRIEPGAPLPSGAPGFILFDPLRHLFFQIGAAEHRLLAHWRTGDAATVRDALVADGDDPAHANAAVAAFHDFAAANGLLRDPPGDAVRTLTARHSAARRGWSKWLLDHYLFVRIPLVRPAAFLARTLPMVRRIWSPPGIAALALIALVGLILATRQWDAFTGEFARLLTPQGFLAYGVALLFVKFWHEAGHAYMATRFGVRVPAMGLSLLVMMPVLYTDTSGAWRLKSRRQRMLIDAAGVLAELSVAAVALFAWSFLPDGPIRTAAFVLATTSIATSLLVNASPFMRFDGYYLLSDWLGVPNLASRAFALGRWRLREALFALGEPPPEDLPRAHARTMIAYAAVTIVYRAVLYVGIALIVYHAFFKALGIALFIVEVFVFLVRPVVSELDAWRARGAALRTSRRARFLAAGAGVALVALFLPLDRSVTLPAVLAPLEDRPLLPGDPARVARILVANGEAVAAGEPLIVLDAPEIALGRAQAELRIAQLESRIARGVADRDDLAGSGVLARDLAAERDRLAGLARRAAALTLRAPSAGRVVDLPPALRPGDWTDGRTALIRVVTPDRFDVRAYAGENDGWRLAGGSVGRFVPDDAGARSVRVRIDEIGAAAAAMLDQPALGSPNGGPIDAVRDPGGGLKARRAVVPVRLMAEAGGDAAFPQPVTGRVVVPARGESLAARIARAFIRVLVRESSLGG